MEETVMPSKAKIYIATTVALGFALLAGSLIGSAQFPFLERFVACAALACIASTLKVRVPGIKGSMSVSFVFVLVAVGQLTLVETLLLGCAATLVQCLWKPKTQPKVIQVLFNVAAMLLSAGAAWAAGHAAPAAPYTPIALAPAAMVYFGMNSLLISTVLALISGEPLMEVWKQAHLWTFPYYLVGAVIASTVCSWSETAGWRAPLLLLLPLYFMYFYYSALVATRTQVQESPSAGR
jgi:hypothetical protein